MEEIIEPISKELLKAELTEEKRLRMTNKSHNQIYIITAQDSPNIMKEIGRLREIAFRAAGGGTGQPLDIDEYDIMDNPYKQLIVWNPEAEEILGGYRYILGTDVRFDEQGAPILATAHMFNFSEKFLKEYLPTTIELGRSFVTVEYQSTRAGSKGLFALDNLWDGLGALTVVMPNVKYFFGKVTMYPSYHRQGRDMILYFLKKHFEDKDNLITPMKPLEMEAKEADLAALFCKKTFKEDYKILNCEIRKLGYNIPPLVNAYMSLSPTMRMFGTAINYGFGDVEETGILIAVDEILAEKRIRHIQSFIENEPEKLQRFLTAYYQVHEEVKNDYFDEFVAWAAKEMNTSEEVMRKAIESEIDVWLDYPVIPEDRLATTFEYLKEYGWVDENVSYEGTYTNEFAQVAADTLGMTDPEAK